MRPRILFLALLAIAAMAILWLVCPLRPHTIADRTVPAGEPATKHSKLEMLATKAASEQETAPDEADPRSPGQEETDQPRTADEPRTERKTLVRGRVTDQDGQPVADKELWLVRRTIGEMILATPSYLCEEDVKERKAKARTDAEGRFELGDVGAGKWWLGVAPVAGDGGPSARGDVAPLATKFEVDEDEPERTVDLKTHRGLALQGKVLLPDGQPAPGCRVLAQIDRMFTFASATTDDQGAFVLSALAPGEVWLQASREGLLADSEYAMAHAGDADVVLRLKAAGAISGSIVDRETRKAAAATLFVTHRDAERGCTQLAGTKGELHLDRLEPGIYDLVASSGDGKVGVARGIVVRSDVEVRDVEIEIAPGARLALKYEGSAEGASFQVFSQEACLGWVTLQHGQSVTQIVPPGPIRIVEMRAEGGVDRMVEMEIGKEQTVELGKK